MRHHVRLDDQEFQDAIEREIAFLRDSGVLGRSSKLRDLFDYLVDRSRTGVPPREVEIAQDVFGRVGQTGEDGAGRVYIHRLRRRLEEVYRDRPDAELQIALPLGEYRLVAEIDDGDGEAVPTEAPASPPVVAAPVRVRPQWWIAAALAVLVLSVVAILTLRPSAEWRAAARARGAAIWAPLFANGRAIIVATGDHYMFAETGADGATRLVRDPQIHSREDLDGYLVRHPDLASRFADGGLSYVPTSVPRAELYLSHILLGASGVRTLPVSQLPAAAMLSQNIVYLGLVSGLGPLRAPVSAGSRFALDPDRDVIRDTRTGRLYRDAPPGRDPGAPRRQYALLSIFAGKEGNRYIVLAGTSGMGLVGLVETVAEAREIDALVAAAGRADTIEAIYQVDSQGAGVLAVKLIATNRRDPARVWVP